MNTGKSRASLLGIAGAYLIYISYQLLKSLIDGEPTSMPRWVLILAIAGFAVIGVAVIFYAWRVWKKGKEDQDKEPDPDQDNSLK